MRVKTADGVSFEIGETEASPTIGITDFSRRETDPFGVTSVVERAFSRRLSVRLALPFEAVDTVQRTLADLRATVATWIADDRSRWLSARGYFKDFQIDHAVPPLSFCTLSVEGLSEVELGSDPGGDPAPEGQTSTLRMIQPVPVSHAVLVATSVPLDDHPLWQAEVSYALGARVISATTHRIYESLLHGNVGVNPEGLQDKWLDVGSSNRWAMFDQAIGSRTVASNEIKVTLAPGNVDGLALLDLTAATVRVQAPGYDRTEQVSGPALTLLDLPTRGDPVTITIAGDGEVALGTLLIGQVRELGVTEASPTSGISDFSRKDQDPFGTVTVIERAWSKRMNVRALIRSDAVDLVADRIASVRARPSLWIGETGRDSLTVYGFFKDFSIEVGETVSRLALTVEGLSKAAPLQPLLPSLAALDPAAAAAIAAASDKLKGIATGADRALGGQELRDDSFAEQYWALPDNAARIPLAAARSGFALALDAGATALSGEGALRAVATPGKRLFARVKAKAADRYGIVDQDGAVLKELDGSGLIDAPSPPTWPLKLRIRFEDADGAPVGDVEVGSLNGGSGRILGSAVAPQGSAFARLVLGGAAGGSSGQWAAWEPWLSEYQPSADVTAEAAPALTVPPALALNADHLGAITSPLPVVAAFRRSRGSVDVTSQASWAAVFPAGVSGSIDNDPASATRGALAVTAATSGGPIRVLSALDGVVLEGVVPVTVTAAMPPSTAPATAGEPASMSVTTPITTTTFVPIGTELAFVAGPDGEADFAANLTYQIQAGNARMAAKWSISADEGASWSDVDVEVLAETEAEVVTDYQEVQPGEERVRSIEDFNRYEERYPGYISVTQAETGLTPGASYRARLLGRRASGSAVTIYPNGLASVTP